MTLSMCEARAGEETTHLTKRFHPDSTDEAGFGIGRLESAEQLVRLGCGEARETDAT
jgi:hypothetical protein